MSKHPGFDRPGPNDVVHELGQRLIFLREREGWNQQQLSEKSQISIRTIIFIENSISVPEAITLDMLLRLARAFRGPIAILFSDYEQKYNIFGSPI